MGWNIHRSLKIVQNYLVERILVVLDWKSGIIQIGILKHFQNNRHILVEKRYVHTRVNWQGASSQGKKGCYSLTYSTIL